MISSLATPMLINRNYTKGRVWKGSRCKIDTITIHHMAGNLSLKGCRDLFNKEGRRASSNYAIDRNGNIACYVDEDNTSWCSSSTYNDVHAVTIELANSSSAPNWEVTGSTIGGLVDLLEDICIRNGIKMLLWKNKKELSLQGNQSNRAKNILLQNMTVHCWFKDKVCPGPYLMKNMPYIAREVNLVMNAKPETVKDFYYTIYLSDVTERDKEIIRKIGWQIGVTEEFGDKLYHIGKFKTKSTFERMTKRLYSEGCHCGVELDMHPRFCC